MMCVPACTCAMTVTRSNESATTWIPTRKEGGQDREKERMLRSLSPYPTAARIVAPALDVRGCRHGRRGTPRVIYRKYARRTSRLDFPATIFIFAFLALSRAPSFALPFLFSVARDIRSFRAWLVRPLDFYLVERP